MDDSTTDEPLEAQTDAEFRAAFAIAHSIGQGGGGEVFLATQLSLSRPVVVKVIQHELIADDVHRRRFQREARMLSRLSHARVTQLYAYGIWVDRPYLVMEYVDGGSLAALMEQGRALEPREAIRIAMEVAEGLAYLHERNMLHRDIKPGNILLTRQRDAKIADFGLARPDGESPLTGDGMVVGTLWYIAPELLTHSEASARTDIYSLGMVTYQMLTLRMAFREDITDLVQLAQARVNEPVVPIQQRDPKLPPEICGLVNRMIARDPEARPRSAAALCDELANLHDALASPSRRLKRKPVLEPEGTEQLSSAAMIQAAAPRRDEPDPRKSKRLRPGRWLGLSARARALAAGFAIAGVAAGLVIGVRMRRGPAPAVETDPRVGRVSELVIERFPKWVHARFTSVTPGQLVVRVTPSGGVLGRTLEAESSDLHEHDVTVEPLESRVGYQVQVRLRLANGQEQAVGSRNMPSPLLDVLGLARDLDKTEVLEALKSYDQARPRRKPPEPERVAEIVERARFRARASALGESAAAVFADPETKRDDRVEIYRGFAPLRVLDRYADAHGLSYRTGVEKLLPFDLMPGLAPLPKSAPAAEARLTPPLMLMPADPQSSLLVDISDQFNERSPLYKRAVERIEGTLEVPANFDRKPAAQVRLTVANVRTAIFKLAIEGVPEPLQFVPPYRAAITGESIALFHTLPTAWLKSGPLKITIRAEVSPCAVNNVSQPLPVYQDVDRNMPRVEEVTLLAQ